MVGSEEVGEGLMGSKRRGEGLIGSKGEGREMGSEGGGTGGRK